MRGYQSDNEARLRAIASVLHGAFYAGPMKLKYVDDQNDWHAVSVQMPQGRRQAILCRTQDQAEAIARMAQLADETLRQEEQT